MLTKEKIFELLKKENSKLHNDFYISRIGLFGSYLSNTANVDSDIDFVVEFYKPIGIDFIKLYDFLEGIFNKKIDIITLEGLKNIRIDSVRNNILNSIEYVQVA